MLDTHKEELVTVVRYLHWKGWAPATSSNYSFRLNGEIWISRSGIDKGMFSPKHLLHIGMDGKPVDEPEVKPSAETGLHTLLYQDPGIQCILHTHTTYNTALSMEGKELTLANYELLKAISGITTHQTTLTIPIFPNSQDIDALAQDIKEYWMKNREMKAFLLAGHGLYTWGPTIAEAKRHIEALEFLFETEYIRKVYGSIGNTR